MVGPSCSSLPGNVDNFALVAVCFALLIQKVKIVIHLRPLPKGARILVWNAQETARVQERYVTLGNREHNPNLSGIREFSLTLVIEGASMKDMFGYTGRLTV